jgi:malate synthase
LRCGGAPAQHFDEQHVMVDGVPAVAAFVDFGLHFFHNAAELQLRSLILPAEDEPP